MTQKLVQKIDDRATKDADSLHVLQKDRFNVPPGSHLPVILPRARTAHQGTPAEHEPATSGDPAGAHVEVARWGFPIPQRPNGVFNTRIESAFESPMWRSLIGKHHAVLAVKGFYEWKKPDKTPYFIHRSDGELLLLGAVAGQRRVDGADQICFSVVTCEPNEAMSKLHDRMPVVLEEADMAAWLTAGPDATLDLAVPAGDLLKVYPVDQRVGNTKEDDADLLKPRAQRSLF